MSHYRLNLFIQPEHAKRLDELAATKGVSKSSIVAAALASWLSPDAADQRAEGLRRRAQDPRRARRFGQRHVGQEERQRDPRGEEEQREEIRTPGALAVLAQGADHEERRRDAEHRRRAQRHLALARQGGEDELEGAALVRSHPPPCGCAAQRRQRTLEQAAASYIKSTGVSIGPAWAPTSKLVFQARYVHEKRDYEGTPAFVLAGLPQREDTFDGIRVSAGYTPRRNIYFSLSYEHGERDSNIIGRDYDYNRVSANAKLAF